MSRTSPTWPRFLLLLLGMAALASGLAGGLARIGWALPLPAATAWHGPLMLGGLFGVVIGLERAVAIGRAWAYGAPLFAGAGTLALLSGEAAAGFAGYALGSAVLLLATLAAARKQAEAFMGVLVLGAFCGLLGHLLLAVGAPFQQTLLPLFGFLVLTIAGERLLQNCLQLIANCAEYEDARADMQDMGPPLTQLMGHHVAVLQRHALLAKRAVDFRGVGLPC